MRRVIALLIAAAAASVGTPARAVAPSVVATVAFTYIPGDLDDPEPAVLAEGGTLVLANTDIDVHTITSFDLTPDGSPVFDSGPVQPTLPRTVRGAESLAPGTYGFYCQVHDGMFGRLTVVDGP